MGPCNLSRLVEEDQSTGAACGGGGIDSLVAGGVIRRCSWSYCASRVTLSHECLQPSFVFISPDPSSSKALGREDNVAPTQVYILPLTQQGDFGQAPLFLNLIPPCRGAPGLEIMPRSGNTSCPDRVARMAQKRTCWKCLCTPKRETPVVVLTAN